MYVEQTGPLAGQLVTFTGQVTSNTLASSHSVKAFIKDFAPDYSSFTTTTVPLVNGVFAQTALTDIPTPGQNATLPNALAISFRIIALF